MVKAMKTDKRPIDCYVIDHTTEDVRKPHRCDTCGDLTTNIVKSLDHNGKVYAVEDGLCDSCLYEYYPNVNW